LICETHHGLICANAGVDRSNSGSSDRAVLLPSDPDRSAQELRAEIFRHSRCYVGVIICDSFGRAWRNGQCDIAIGCAGIEPLADYRGQLDRDGRPLTATLIAIADQLAAAADLTRTKSSGEPAAVIRGLDHLTTPTAGPGARVLIRESSRDLFR
jgi:coenzyme F420-0:L-glutamate ligase/coenzyme F420-1:gamma-L-glutamate ligase